MARSRETFEPVVLRKREASLLGVKPRTPVLLVEGTSFSEDGAPVEFSRTYVRGDRSRYFVERTVRISRDQRRPRPEGRRPTKTPTAAAFVTGSD